MNVVKYSTFAQKRDKYYRNNKMNFIVLNIR